MTMFGGRVAADAARAPYCNRAMLRRGIALLLVAAAMAFGAPSVRAEVLDELEVFRSGADAIVRISFSARMQYLRHAASGGIRFEIFFQLITAPGESTTQEHRSIAATATFPGVTVTFPVQTNARQLRLVVQFSRPVSARIQAVGNRAIEIVVPGAGKDVTAGRAARAQEAAAAIGDFVIELETLSTADIGKARPVPSEFQDYSVFSTQSRRDGKTQHEMLLGYFPDAATAEQARQKLLVRFPNARVVDLAARREQSLRAAKPAPAVPLLASPTMPPPVVPLPGVAPPRPETPGIAAPGLVTPDASADVKIEERATELMTKARAALDANNNELAIDLFNQLLVLPPNRQSRQAQELIGLARERSGERAKAKAEYELYVRLFPEGEDAARVRKRLADLESSAEAPEARPRRGERQPIRSVQGSFSQFYYGGKSRAETAFNTPTTVDRSSFSGVDQAAMVTSADLTGRFRSASSDQRLVFRDTHTTSFLDRRPSFNRLNAAYWDYKGLDNALSSRLGRQTGLSGGVPGRFDGGVAGYGITPKVRLNAVGGVPVEYPQIDAKRVFYGLNMDFEDIAEHWHGNVFAINQTVDNILDRRAVGSEVRYLKDGSSVFTFLDYDVSYAALNTAMVQGSWQTAGQSTLNVLFDRRRAPSLTTTNALFGQGTTSIMTLLQSMTEEEIRRQARDVTATANQALIGFTTPLSKRWQIGADARLTNVGALPATVINELPVPAQPATGNIWSYSIQTIGTNLLSGRDTHVLTGTLLRSPNFDGWLAAYNHLSFLTDNWTFEPSFKYYAQKDILDTQLTRMTPGLRLVYRIHQSVALEADALWERSKTVSTTVEDVTTRTFFSVGYRVDF